MILFFFVTLGWLPILSHASQEIEAAPLGCNFNEEATYFGVWAPNADKVFVRGDFNSWMEPGYELFRDERAHFSGKVRGVKKGDGYQFVIHRNGNVYYRADPRGLISRPEDKNTSRVYDHSTYVWSDQNFTPPSAETAVIYELYIPTFTTGPDGKSGSFSSAVAKLDYLKSLGINVIEMLPIAESDGTWGYAPTQIYAPRNDYGEPDQLKDFVNAAHSRGIAVLFDWVSGYMPRSSPLINFDGAGNGPFGVYFFGIQDVEVAFGIRPNYEQREVSDWLFDGFKSWIDHYHFDGARFDSVKNVRSSQRRNLASGWNLLKRINDFAHGRESQNARHKLTIAEDLQGNWNEITASTHNGDRNDVYFDGAGFDSQWDDSYGGDRNFYTQLAEEFSQANDGARRMHNIASAIGNYAGDLTKRVVFVEDHDRVSNQRLITAIDPQNPHSFKAMMLSGAAATMVLTSPGIPMIFQGQEFLESLAFSFPTPPPLTWSNADKFQKTLALYSDLIALRKTKSGLRGNNLWIYRVDEANKVIAYRRWGATKTNDDVLVIANLSASALRNYTLGFPQPGQWRVLVNTDSKSYSYSPSGLGVDVIQATAGLAADGFASGAPVDLAPYVALVISQ